MAKNGWVHANSSLSPRDPSKDMTLANEFAHSTRTPDCDSYGGTSKGKTQSGPQRSSSQTGSMKENKRNTEQEAADSSVGGGQRFGMVLSEEGI